MHKILLLSFIICFSLSLRAAEYKFSNSQKNIFSGNKVYKIKNTTEESLVFFNLLEMKTSHSLLKGFSKLNFEKLKTTSAVDLPEIPYKNFIVSGDYKKIKISIDKDKGYFFNNLHSAPASKFPCRCKKNGKITSRFKKSKYFSRKDKFYNITPLGSYRGEKIFLVTFFMAQVDNKKNITLYPHIKFSLIPQSGTQIHIFDEGEFFDIDRDQSQDLVLIGKKELLRGADEYIIWKKNQGFSVHTFSLEDIGSSKVQIKEYLMELYSTIKMEFVIILGDDEDFPTFYKKTSNHPRTPSDLDYFLMDGKEDKIPDVLYGRIPATNSNQVRKILSKVIYFEKNKNPVKNVIGIASNEGSGPSDIEYMDEMIVPLTTQLGMREKEFFQDRSQSNVENINKSLSDGALWLNYIGHGSGDSWPSINKGSYTWRNVFDINIQKSLPIIIDVACQNGRFSRDNRLGVTFMNSGFTGGHRGSTAYYGGSVDISWHPPAIMAVGINKYLARRKSKTLGQVLLSGQIYLLSNYDATSAALENFVWYNLLGDPSLSLENIIN